MSGVKKIKNSLHDIATKRTCDTISCLFCTVLLMCPGARLGEASVCCDVVWWRQLVCPRQIMVVASEI